MQSERLQKVLARAGVASRRAAEQLIAAGRVRVDGRVVTELGTKVDPRRSRVEVDGQRVFAEDLVYVVLNKPRNVVSTMSDPQGRPSVKEILAPVAGRVYPVGRLDFATSGVLLATNDGDFSMALLHPKKAVPKTYVVKVQGEMATKDLDHWRKGVELADDSDARRVVKTLPARVKLLRHEAGKTWFELTITEGRNQQVRRMGEATGFRVMRLSRLEFAGITSEGLRPGGWRYLSPDELRDLKRDYGVPKRIVSPPEAPAPARKPAQPARSVHAGHPRYGGGSPARRDVGVRDDWGGGVQRGSSGGRGHREAEEAPRWEIGGRGGRSRTTGTGGGIGGHGDERSYRVKGRRG
jgi:23S rRNA pseudouridine2605 synthase